MHHHTGNFSPNFGNPFATSSGRFVLQHIQMFGEHAIGGPQMCGEVFGPRRT